MDMINIALELQNDGYFEKAEKFQQVASKILSKKGNQKHRANLTVRERKTIKEKNDTALKLYSFDKGLGFVIMKEEKAI